MAPPAGAPQEAHCRAAGTRVHVRAPTAAKAAVGGPLGGVRPDAALTAALGSLLTDPRGRAVYLTKYTETLAAGPEIRREHKVHYSLLRAVPGERDRDRQPGLRHLAP